MTSLATAFVEGRIDTSRFGSDIRRGMASSTVGTASTDAGKSTGSRFSSAFGTALKIGATLGAAFAVTKGVQFLKGTIDEAREASKVSALTAAAIKSTGSAANVTADHVAALSQRISEKVGVDDEAIQSGANLLLTFKNISNQVGAGNKIFDRANVAITDMSAALGQETKASAIQLGKALNDPIAGITALSRVGVTFTEQQKEQIAGMVESGNIMKAQKTILRELGSEFGGAGAAMADPIDKAKVAFSNLQEEIGTYLLPKLADLATWFVAEGLPALRLFGGFLIREVIPAVAAFGGFVRDHIKTLGVLGGVLLTGAVAWKVYKIQQAISLVLLKAHTVGTIQHTVVSGIAAAATKAWAVAMLALNAVMAGHPLALVVIAVTALAAGLVIAYKKSDTFRAIVDKTWSVVKSAVSSAWDFIKPALVAFGNFLTDVGQVVKWLWDKAIRPTFAAIGQAIQFWWERVTKPVLLAVWKFIRDVLGPVYKWLWDNIVKPVFKLIGDAVKFWWNNVTKPVFQAVWKFIRDVLGPVFHWLYDNVVKPVFDFLRQKISDTWNKGIKPIFQALGGFIKHTVAPAFKAGVAMIGRFWDGLKRLAAKPVNFLINTVYMKGIKPLIEKVAGAVNLDIELPTISPVEWAFGGYTGPGGKYEPAGIVHRGEYVIRKESREQIERAAPGLLDRMNQGGDVTTVDTDGPPRQKLWRRMREYWLGGGVMPMPAATSISPHATPYYGAWYAADFNGVGDDTGKPIVAWKAGTVAQAAMNGDDGSYGNVTQINHSDGNHTLYAHQAAIMVAVNQLVRAGQRIGSVGAVGNASGPHLHFEIEGGDVSPSGGGILPGVIGAILAATPDWALQAIAEIGKIKGDIAKAAGMAGNFSKSLAGGFANIADGLKDWIMEQVGSVAGSLAAPGGAVGPAQDYAIDQLAHYQWTAAQWEPLRELWERESGWSVTADNPTSAAYGIPQANPGSKMASEGADWRTNYVTQIDWGLKYIRDVYGTPAAAWAHSESTGWYDKGGKWPSGTLGFNGSGYDETVLDPRQSRAYERVGDFLAKTGSGATGGLGGPLVHIDTVQTTDPDAAARAIVREQRKALAVAGGA